MKKYFTINYIGGFASTIALLLFVYFQFIKTDNKIIYLNLGQAISLTEKKTDYDELQAQYFFNDSIVDNLWVLNFKLNNIGSQSIIGKGDRKDFIDEKMTLNLSEDFNILKLDSLSSNFPYSINYWENQIEIGFKQFKPDEFLEYRIFLIGKSKNENSPKLSIDERGLIEIETKVLEQNETVYSNRFMDRYSETVQNILSTISLLFLFIFMVIVQLSIMNWGKRRKNKIWYWLGLVALVILTTTISLNIV